MQAFLLIASLHFFAVITPGQDFIWVVKQTIAYGRRGGVLTALGIALGILLFSLASAFGMQVVIQHAPILLSLLKLLGALYLLYIGSQMLRATAPIHVDDAGSINTTISKQSLVRTGLLVNISNVKAILFFITLFSSAISPQTAVPTLLLYAVWMSFATFAWFSFLACIVGQRHLRQKLLDHSLLIDRISGVLFILIALWLLIKTSVELF